MGRVLKFLVSLRREHGSLSKDFSSLLAANNRQADDLSKMQHKIKHWAHKVSSTRTDLRFYNYSEAHCNLENLKSWMFPKILGKSKKNWKHTPTNFCYFASFGMFWTRIGLFLWAKSRFKNFSCCPSVKSRIFFYKLNTRWARPISFQKLQNLGKTFFWYRHSICHYGWPTNSHFGSFSTD